MVGANNLWYTNEARHGRSEDTIQECAICMDELSSFDNDEPIARLTSCPHIFHANCVEKWRLIGSNGNLCPVCRVPMHVVEVAPAPAPAPPTRLIGNRHTQVTRHEARMFLHSAGELRRSLSTKIYSYRRRLMLWLADENISTSSLVGMLAVILLSVGLVLFCVLTGIIALLNFIIINGLQYARWVVIPFILLIIFAVGSIFLVIATPTKRSNFFRQI